jgi:8-oxo-dGTP diphosphatase
MRPGNVVGIVASKTIQAAGGIVARKGARPLIAVVQRSKDDRWVLPRGKLKRDENPVTGAQREVVEETGHRVKVNEFLGAITYRARGRPKVVQFWHMQAEEEASYELMTDIVAVEWLPLKAAVRRLSYPLEKLFLRNVGWRALARRRPKARRKPAKKKSGKTTRKTTGKSTNKKSGQKANKKTNRKTALSPKPGKRKKPKRAFAHSTKSQVLKSSARKSAAVRKSAALRTPSANYSASKLMTAMPSAPERAVSPVAAMPAANARRKTILQRVLGRIAG